MTVQRPNSDVDKFPNSFLFGAATSSYQVEGGNYNADWFEWEKSRDLTPCRGACNSWEHFNEDINLLKDFGLNSYRLSLEWSRIYKNANEIDYKALEHYERMLSLLKDNNIKTFVTLQHHTLPKWLTMGWENPDIPDFFVQYVRTVAEKLYPYTDAWMPINEPAVNNVFGYVMGLFPPGKMKHLPYLKVAGNQMISHYKAYNALKEIAPDIPVGFVKQMLLFKPYRNIIRDRLLTAYYDYMFNSSYLNSFKSGRLPFSIKWVSGLKDTVDFWALNYYTHKWVSFSFPEGKRNCKYKKIRTTQTGWEWDPGGIEVAAKRLWKVCRKPIYITECGIATPDDDRRKLYICLHLRHVLKLLKEDIDIRGFFYWSLLDNFEWYCGYKPKFGLAAVDKKTFSRLPRSSGYYLGKIAKDKELIKPEDFSDTSS